MWTLPRLSGWDVRDRARRWREWHPAPVDWYSPRQLVRTGLDSLLSVVFGQRIDTRLIQQVGAECDCVFTECAREQGEDLVFDFAADTGDGWFGTYTLAQLLSTPWVVADGAAPLRRADLVILGGDQAYPVASTDCYARRLVFPFNEAARNLYGYDQQGWKSVRRSIFLLPGNHDWYDSLAAFVRRFCHRRSLGAFRTVQRRSYWTIELPHGWWIWAVDIQLGRDIDATQYQFFCSRAASLGESNRVILCAAEPEIVYGKRETDGSLRLTFDKLQDLVEARGARVPLRLAGNVHNYQRYEIDRRTNAGVQYPQVHIVSGGGGAFLHPTHSFHGPHGGRFENEGSGASDAASDDHVPCLQRYPPASISRSFAKRNLYFAISHPGMATFIGAVYLLLFWGVPADANLTLLPIEHLPNVLAMAFVIWGTTTFAGARPLLGAIHGSVHLAIAFALWRWAPCVIAVGSEPIAIGACGDMANAVVHTYGSLLLRFFVGALVGGTVLGTYLYVGLNVFRIHHNEAFSSLRIADYKNFLRCTVGPEGVRIRAIAIPAVHRTENMNQVETFVVDEAVAN